MRIFFLLLFICQPLFLTELSPLELAAKFSNKRHLNPPELSEDPYEKALEFKPQKSSVCGILYGENKESYQTKTYVDKDAAQADKAHITHLRACGTCSSLQDLAVYLAKPDLTKPGKKCAMLSWLKPASILCFKRLGFSEACATTWYYNARNTAKKCFWTCFGSFLINEASNLADGSLNKCLQCDEKESGPIFKKTAGRTRRNSGIVSSIRRSEKEVAHIVHDYY